MGYTDCKNCEKRTLGCHATCESYLKFKEERVKMLEEKRKQSILDGYDCKNKHKRNGYRRKDYSEFE
jgi:hypothetical protein